MERVISLAIGYLFGIFQTGYIVGKIKHIDIRKEGSGNAGSTNAFRVLGMKAGVVTLSGDMLKCAIAIIVVRNIFRGSEILPLLSMYAGLGATLGHDFPFYMRFKGGKGIAVLVGTIILTGPYFVPIPIAAFATAFLLTKFVSLGSLLIALMFFLETVILGQFGVFQMAQPYLFELYAVVFLISLLAWIRHSNNIKRLLGGQEKKLKPADK